MLGRLHASPDYLYGHCAKGKLRRRGKRLPFFWAVPRPAFFPAPTFDVIVQLAERMGKPAFLIPTLVAATRKVPAHWAARPMSHAMSARLVRRSLARAGVPARELTGACFGTCRRFLPTAAQVLQFDRQTCQAVGNWVEREGVPADLPSAPMSVHYSDARGLASGAAKRDVLDRLLAVLGRCPGAQDVLNGLPISAETKLLDWPDIDAAWRAYRTHPDHPTPSSSSSSCQSVVQQLEV